MAVITKKDEKAKAVIERLINPDDMDEFKKLFKELYPDDFAKIQMTFFKEERKDKKGKGHPMPHPDIYLSNMFKVAKKMIMEEQ